MMKNEKRQPRILISAGPTVEPIDPVRFISNRSEGVAGFSIAKEALKRGYQTTIVSGPTAQKPLKGATIFSVRTAAEMFEELKVQLKKHDCLIMAAAVCDFRVVQPRKNKIKKSSTDNLTIKLAKNPDILKKLRRLYPAKKIFIGFSLESEKVLENSLRKLKTKKLDLVVANSTKNPGGPFGKYKNTFFLIDSDKTVETHENIYKFKLAKVLLDKVEAMWYGKIRIKRHQK